MDVLDSIPTKRAKRLTPEQRAARAGKEADDEPPLIESKSGRWQRVDPFLAFIGLVILLAVLIIVATLLFPGFVPMSRAAASDNIYSISTRVSTWTPQPMTPTPQPTRTRFPTATSTAMISVMAQLITQEYPYGWYGEMASETEYNKNLCTHEVNLELCDYGFSTVNLSPYTGPGLEPYPRRFVVFFRWHGYARWWSELKDGKGEPFRIGQGLPFTRAELEQGICVPVFWNIVADPSLNHLNGRIGKWSRQIFLGEAAGVSELPEDVSAIPTALQLEIFDKPPEGCNTITDGFPSEHLPEYLRTEQ